MSISSVGSISGYATPALQQLQQPTGSQASQSTSSSSSSSSNPFSDVLASIGGAANPINWIKAPVTIASNVEGKALSMLSSL